MRPRLCRQVVKLRVITSENAALKKDIKDLKTQFGQAAYAEEHGGDASAFVGGDITDLYAVEKVSVLWVAVYAKRDILRGESTITCPFLQSSSLLWVEVYASRDGV